MTEAQARTSVRWTVATIAVVSAASFALLIASGNAGIALAPAVAAGVLYLVWRLPLHISGVALFFMLLGLERRDDVANLYHTPLLALGDAVTTKFSVLTHIKVLQMTGGDVLCLLFLLIALARAGTRPEIDGRRIQVARPLVWCAVLSILTLGLQLARGLRANGDLTVALWQFRTLVHVPFYFLVFQLCIRGAEDFPLVGKALVLAAAVRSCQAIFVRYFATLRPHLRPIEFLTSHDDSMTFALAMCTLLISLSEKTDRRSLWPCLTFLPLIGCGALLNKRRLAWVDLGFALVLYAILSQRTPLKRAIERGLIALLPAAAIYIAVGWNSQARVFAPVQLVKSLVSSESSRSTLDRDVENWNLATSVQTNPLLGRGLGHEYDERVKMDDISAALPMYRALPHNSALGLWVFLGILGVLGVWPLYVLGIYFGARACRNSQLPEMRTAAYAAIAAILIFLNQSYGDMGFWGDIGPLLAGMALVVAGKAAVASGAWPAQPLRSLYAAEVARRLEATG